VAELRSKINDALGRLEAEPAGGGSDTGGANALAALFNNMSDQGATEFAKLLNEFTPEDAQKLGRKLSTASSADVKAMAQALNVGSAKPGPSFLVGTTRSLAGHRNRVACLTFTSDSRTLISAEQGRDAKLILWDLPDGRAAHTRDVGSWVDGVCISGDGKTLAVYSQTKRVYVFQMPGAEPLLDLDPQGEFIGAIALSPNGRLLATAGKWNEHPKLWSIPEGNLLYTFPQAVNTRALQFSPDGRLLMCAAEREPLSVWSVPDGKLVKRLPEEVGDVYTNTLTFSADGEFLITGDGNNKVRFIKVIGGQLVFSSKAFTNHWSLAISPDGKLVAGSGDNNSVVVWSFPDGQVLCELHGHTEIGQHLALSDEPRVLVSSGTNMGAKRDHTVRLGAFPMAGPSRSWTICPSRRMPWL
jgi:WD40 repeat protein